MKKTMIFFDSLCSLINPCRIYIDEILCSIAMGRERENGNENERKRICRSTKLNDICFFLFWGAESVGRARKVVQILQTYKIFPGDVNENRLCMYIDAI